MSNEKCVSNDTLDKTRAKLLFKKMQERLGGMKYFTPGNVTHDKMLGFKLVEALKPFFRLFLEEGLIEEAGKEGRYKFTGEEPEINVASEDISNEGTFDEDIPDEDFPEDAKLKSKKYVEEVEEEVKKYKKFIITSAVVEKEVNEPFLKSIENYAERNEALILIIPCRLTRGGRDKDGYPPPLSPALNKFKKVYKGIQLNENLCISALSIPALAVNPSTGLERTLVSMKSSTIVGSPRVMLKHVPNKHYAIPPAIMTTGAVTKNNYDTRNYLVDKSEFLAETDHSYGAVVVEIENEKIFHFRHVTASETGSFIDLGVEYLPNGEIRITKDNVMVMGDSHIGYHDQELHEEALRLAYDTDVKEVILHDIFHGSSVSHHDAGKSITNAIKANQGRLGLERECLAVKNYLESIVNQGFKVTIVKSNHDNHLFRYLDEGRFKDDIMNYAFSLKLASAAVDKKDPLQYAIEEEFKYKSDKVNWLVEDEGYEVYGVEVSHHGSTGANGSRGSLALFEKGLDNCVTAHTHSAAILRNAYCVGTVGFMDMGYNKGLSSWTRTCCIIYSNGTKQLVNFIPDGNGNYSYRI